MVCPHCGNEVTLFDDGTQKGAQRMGLPLLASLPWRKELAQSRALRWSALSNAARKDADNLANEVELALASSIAAVEPNTPSSASAPSQS